MAKSFKGYMPAQAIEFDLESPDGQRKVTIHCKTSIPGSKFLDFIGQAQSTEDFAGLSHAVKDILNAAIKDEDHAEFWAFCDVPENGIGLHELSEIAGWMSEQFAGDRPTQPLAVSAPT
jgi:hypothetical protein